MSSTSFAAARVDQPKCPFCQMSTLKDTTSTDYRVSLTINGKTFLYRCVMCAVADANSRKGDLQIDAASEKKGQPVKITRVKNVWTVSPNTAVFVFAEGDHEQCQTRYRALTSPEAFKSYVSSDPKVLKNAKQVSLSQLIKLAG